MLRYLLPLLLCLAAALAAAYVVYSRGSGRHRELTLRLLSDRAIELATQHRELDGDKELASAVLKRAARTDGDLPGDLLLLAEQHIESSPALAYALIDAARDARRELP